MNCQNYLNLIREIKAECAYFDELSNNAANNLPKLLAQREKLEMEVSEQIASWPAKQFYAHLEKPEVLRGVMRIFEQYNKEITGMMDRQEILWLQDVMYQEIFEKYFDGKFRPVKNFSEKHVEAYWNILSDEKKDELFDKMLQFGSPPGEGAWSLLFDSAFINSFISEDSVIRLKKLPHSDCHIGAFLRQGTIIVESKDEPFTLGQLMKGGTIIARQATNIGSGLSGGKIFMQGAHRTIGECMIGGFISIEKHESEVAGVGMSGGLIYSPESLSVSQHFKGGQVICDNIPIDQGVGDDKYGLASARHRLWTYDDRAGDYINLQNTVLGSAAQRKTVEMHRESSLNEEDGIMGFCENYESEGVNPTEGQTAGVWVLRTLIKDIGKNMTGGAVIVEVPGVTIEQVRANISPEKQGGVILLRVKDDNGKSRLVDAEQMSKYSF